MVSVVGMVVELEEPVASGIHVRTVLYARHFDSACERSFETKPILFSLTLALESLFEGLEISNCNNSKSGVHVYMQLIVDSDQHRHSHIILHHLHINRPDILFLVSTDHQL